MKRAIGCLYSSSAWSPATILGLYVEQTLGSGAFDIPLISLVVSGDIPTGIHVLEAAILDPITGVTLSRNSLQGVVPDE
jgi:hypothetical protein